MDIALVGSDGNKVYAKDGDGKYWLLACVDEYEIETWTNDGAQSLTEAPPVKMEKLGGRFMDIGRDNEVKIVDLETTTLPVQFAAQAVEEAKPEKKPRKRAAKEAQPKARKVIKLEDEGSAEDIDDDEPLVAADSLVSVEELSNPPQLTRQVAVAAPIPEEAN